MPGSPLENQFTERETSPVHSDGTPPNTSREDAHARSTSTSSAVSTATLGDDNIAHGHNATRHERKVQSDGRRKLAPKRQRDRQKKPGSPISRCDYVSEIVFEQPTEGEELPKDYVGTWRGFQFTSPSSYHDGLCGAEPDLHQLTCGHWIKSIKPCGINCKSPVYKNEAFVCNKCYDNVKDILKSQLSSVEQERLAHVKEGYHVFFIALAVELVTKYSTNRANITETVISVLDEYGRPSARTDGPTILKPVRLEQYVREIQQIHERKEFEARNPLIRHEKRSHIEPHHLKPDEHHQSGTAAALGHKKRKMHIDKDAFSANGNAYGVKRKYIYVDAVEFQPRVKKVAATTRAVNHNQPTNLQSPAQNANHRGWKRDHDHVDESSGHEPKRRRSSTTSNNRAQIGKRVTVNQREG